MLHGPEIGVAFGAARGGPAGPRNSSLPGKKAAEIDPYRHGVFPGQQAEKAALLRIAAQGQDILGPADGGGHIGGGGHPGIPGRQPLFSDKGREGVQQLPQGVQPPDFAAGPALFLRQPVKPEIVGFPVPIEEQGGAFPVQNPLEAGEKAKGVVLPAAVGKVRQQRGDGSVV